MELRDVFQIGENDAGYEFRVGRLGERWVGFALGALDDGEQTVFLFAETSEGEIMGMQDKAEAIKRTALVADVAYGGVDRWSIAAELRPAPGAFVEQICDVCGGLFCDDIRCYHRRNARRAAGAN